MGGRDTRYCNKCGQRLQADARICGRCGAEQPSPDQPSQGAAQGRRSDRNREQRPSRQRTQRSEQTRGRGSGQRRARRSGPRDGERSRTGRRGRRLPSEGRRPQGSDDSTTLPVIVAVIVGIAIVLFLAAPILGTFVLGLGDSVDGAGQTDPEVVTERFFQALADGDQQEAQRYAHSDGPAATELDDVESYPNRPMAEDVAVTDWAVLEEDDDRMVLDVALEYDGDSADPTTQFATVELRTENGEWRVWSVTVG